MCAVSNNFIYKKKKEEVRCMLFQITLICFIESDYVTLHAVRAW